MVYLELHLCNLSFNPLEYNEIQLGSYFLIIKSLGI